MAASIAQMVASGKPTPVKGMQGGRIEIVLPEGVDLLSIGRDYRRDVPIRYDSTRDFLAIADPDLAAPQVAILRKPEGDFLAVAGPSYIEIKLNGELLAPGQSKPITAGQEFSLGKINFIYRGRQDPHTPEAPPASFVDDGPTDLASYQRPDIHFRPVSAAERKVLADFSTNHRFVNQILSDPTLQPRDVLRVEGYDFYFSQVIRVKKHLFAAALVKTVEDGQVIFRPRLFYKSQSGGNWRYTPYQILGHLQKGRDVHYTAETQLARDIELYLEAQDLTRAPEVDRGALKYFNAGNFGERTMEMAQASLDEGFDFPEIPGLKRFQRYEAGAAFARGNHEILLPEDLLEMEYPPSFIPDFHQPPVDVYSFEHSLLGKTTVEVFAGGQLRVVGHKGSEIRPVLWGMARDGQGRTWIQFIRFADTPMNSQGTYQEVINSGFLTSKPLDYSNQVDRIPDDLKVVVPATPYTDITPFLAQLEPIKLYRQALEARP